MYTEINFKSKKAFKEHVAAGHRIGIYQTNDIFNNPKGHPTYTGEACVEGPWYPKPHSWYATVKVVEGVVTKVK